MTCIVIKRVTINPQVTCPGATCPKPQLVPDLDDQPDLLTLSNFGLSQPQEVEEDKPITGTYTTDFNILEVHRKVVRIIAANGPRVAKLQCKLQVLQAQVDQPGTMIEKKRLAAQIDKLTNQLSQLTTGQVLADYMSQAEPLIKQYIALGPERRVVSLDQVKTDRDRGIARVNVELDLNQPAKVDESTDRLAIITQYLDVARRFVEIDIMQQVSYNPYCACCGYNLADLEGQEIAVNYCPNCGLECNLVNQFATSLSSDKPAKDSYDDRVNMLRAIKRFQGKQANKIPAALFRKLDDHFRTYSLPTADEIRQRPLDSHGKRQGTSLDMLLQALSDTGYSAYYEDANLIGHLYWGWSLPDIDHLIDTIMKDYDESQRVFERIKGDRKSCLNTQYRLFRHLQRCGYPCSKKDFKIVSTQDVLETYEQIWSTICRELGWTFQPII